MMFIDQMRNGKLQIAAIQTRGNILSFPLVSSRTIKSIRYACPLASKDIILRNQDRTAEMLLIDIRDQENKRTLLVVGI